MFASKQSINNMKKTLLFILTTCFLSFASAQVECAHLDIKSYLQTNDSTFNQRYHQYMINSVAASKTMTKGEIKEFYAKRSTAPNFTHYIIPIVVHVVHNNGIENISDAQIFNQIDSLNNAFKAYNIQFCLAKMKPDSTPFNGITRIQNSLTDYRVNIDNDALMDLNVFPRDKYLNIWIVKSIKNDDGSPSNRVGSAYSPLGEKLGIAIRYDFFGNYTTCSSCNINSASRGKVLVHEMGHFLGLEHTHHGKTCGGSNPNNCNIEGDYICDTPPMQLVSSQCSTSNSCSDTIVFNQDLNDPIHNYMSYKTETCLKEFTPEQVQLMHWQIETYLAPLIDIDNLNYVLKQGCGQISALFKPSLYTACQTTTITLRAFKKYPNCKFQWQIKNTSNNQTFTSSQLTDSLINYSCSTGVYDVTLEVFSGNYSISRTIKQLITVQNCGNTIASERGNWYFGAYAGLEFKQNATIANEKALNNIWFTPTINSLEGCIVQNNKAGGLLFYGGGKSIGQNDDSFYLYNKRHQKMPNGTVFGSGTSTQGGLAVPVPGDGKKYYLFTTNHDNRNGNPQPQYGLRYSIIDTSLNGGNGDVIISSKNTPVLAQNNRHSSTYDNAVITGEGIAAIPGCDSTFYYLIVTSLHEDSLVGKFIEVYKVTSTSVTHHSQLWVDSLFKAYGTINASADGRFVSVCGVFCEFDRFTGKLKFIKNLQDSNSSNQSHNYYSVFSPNGNAIYIMKKIDIGGGDYTNELRQYDLSNLNSYTKLNLKSNAFGLQYGPDNKLYISQFDDNYISVINKPNAINDFQNNNKIQYQQDKINLRIGLANMKSMGGLPNFIDAAPQKDIPIQVFHRIESCNSFYFYTNQCCKTNYVWDFGDGDTAHGKTATHSFTGKTGIYYVSLTLDGSITLYDTIQFGITGTALAGLTTTCDTTNPSYFYVNKPKTNLYQYDWAVTNGTYTSKFPRTGAEVKWTSDNGTVTLYATDKYGCKDTANLQFAFANLINNNIISATGDCNSVTFTSSIPTGGNGTFNYYWKESNNGNNFTLIPGEINLDYQPPFSNVTKYYQRIVRSNGCENYSNIVRASTFQNDNVIREYYMFDDLGKCDLKLKGTNIKQFYPTATVVWQKSTDSSTWLTFTPASDTLTSSVEKNLAKVYYRRVCSLDTCISYSNVLKYSNIIPWTSNLYFCKNLEFPFTVSYNQPSGFYKINFEFERNSKWYKYTNAKVDYNNNTITAHQDADVNNRIKKGEKMRIRFEKEGCFIPYNDLYSNDIVPKFMDTFFIITQPQNKTIVAGNSSYLKVKVNKPEFCKFKWQYSHNLIKWDTLENGNTDSLFIDYTSACHSNLYFRCQIKSPCKTIITDTAQITVTNLKNPTFDYWMKNSVLDKGNEPDSFSQSFAFSQDIWIRNNQDGIKQHQDLNTESSLCYVYVTVRNRGKNPTKSAKLYTYWTWGATNESWKLNWTKNPQNIITNSNGSFPMGGEINTTGISVPEIPANSSIDIAIPWSDFPKKGWYDLNQQKWQNQKINICLLARIETCDYVSPFGMTYPEQTDVFYNIKYNNNIVSRNTYTLPLQRFVMPDDHTKDNNGQKYRVINPNIIDGGTIAVRNNHDEAQKYSLCFKTYQSDYFTLAETYIEIGDALKSAIEWSPNVTLSGLTHVVDNIYQVTSSNACINSLVLPAHFQDAVLPLFAYKDINNRFADGLSFNTSIQQKDSLGNLMGECIFTLTDNLFVNPEPTYIESDTSFYFCNDGINNPETFVVSYSSNNAFPTQIYNENGTALTPNNSIYQLSEGYYTEVSIDSAHFTHYVKNINVIIKDEEIVNQTELIQIDCESLPFQLNTNDESVIVYENNTPMDSTSFNYYLLFPIYNFYKTEYRNAATCQLESKVLDFMDILQTPPTDPSAYVFAKYDRTEDSCAFVRLSDLSCNGTPLTFGKTIDIYNMDLQFLYTASIEQYGNSTIGFRFCPPNWNTHENYINEWHHFIYKANLCEYCRIDFKADSMIVFDKVTSINSIKNEWIKLYPNPTSKEVNIELLTPINEPITIVMFDIMGKEVKRINVDSSNKNLVKYSVEHLSAGVYHIYIPQLGYAKKLIVMKEE
jgi:hypothetical protein